MIYSCLSSLSLVQIVVLFLALFPGALQALGASDSKSYERKALPYTPLGSFEYIIDDDESPAFPVLLDRLEVINILFTIFLIREKHTYHCNVSPQNGQGRLREQPLAGHTAVVAHSPGAKFQYDQSCQKCGDRMKEASFDSPENHFKCLVNVLMCPILRRLMSRPALTATGHTFEQSAIETWLETRQICPMTRLPLLQQDLTPNFELRRLITWIAQHVLDSRDPRTMGEQRMIRCLKTFRDG